MEEKNIKMSDNDIKKFTDKYTQNEYITLADAIKETVIEDKMYCQYNTGDTFILAEFREIVGTHWNLIFGFNVRVFATNARIDNYVFSPCGGYIKIKEYGDNIVELR